MLLATFPQPDDSVSLMTRSAPVGRLDVGVAGSIEIELSTFEVFYREQYPSTKRLAHLLTGSQAVAEDLTQDVFAAVFPRYEQLERPVSYLRAVTVNRCRRHHRRAIGERSRLRRIGVDDVLVPAETAELLSGLRRLPFGQQAVLVLRYWGGLTEAEVAEALGRPIGTVKSWHHRALDALRKEFA